MIISREVPTDISLCKSLQNSANSTTTTTPLLQIQKLSIHKSPAQTRTISSPSFEILEYFFFHLSLVSSSFSNTHTLTRDSKSSISHFLRFIFNSPFLDGKLRFYSSCSSSSCCCCPSICSTFFDSVV